MGSKFALGFAWAALLFAGTGAGAVELNDAFADDEQIESWADAYYFGGHTLQSFERDGVTFVVLIGMRGSGLVHSEVSVYAAGQNEPYKLALFLPSKPVSLTSEEGADGIVIKHRDVVVSTLSFESHGLRQPRTVPLVELEHADDP